MKTPRSAGGWRAIWYTIKKGREAGGFFKLWQAMRSKNACKTCALGMGGQAGGMVNETGHFPEVCKKSLQAMVADMQGAIRPDFWPTYSLPQLQAFSPRELEHCGRLTQPVIAAKGEQYYRPISWDEAFERITKKLKAIRPDESFWYFSGRSSNEAGFLLQLFARLYGTNNVNNCSYYCHQASGVGLTAATGSGAGTIVLEDLEQADLVFVIGGNPASNHPRLMRSLMMVRRNGGDIVVVNPVVELGLVNFRVPSDVRSLLFGTEIASQYVQPDIGGDLAFLTGVAKRIDELGKCDATFLDEHCTGWTEWRDHLRAISWDEIIAKSGVSREQIEQTAERYARAKNVVFSWTMGVTHHAHGVATVQTIANLAMMRGMLGRPRAGLLPIRGHSNVQGIGTVGVTPKLKEAIFDRLQSHFGVKLPTEPGLDTLACMEAAEAGKFRLAVCLGGNLYGSNPDAQFAAKALGKLETLVYLNTTLNTGHAHGLAEETIILPVLARDEEPQPTTQESMFSYIRLSDGGPRRHEGPRSEIEIVAQLAAAVLGDDGPIAWSTMSDTDRIRAAMAKIIPGLEQLETIGQTKQEFAIEGRHIVQPKFGTPDGRAHLFTHPLPELAGTSDELRMMTVRSEGQFNTVVYEEEDLYRGQERRDVILVHPTDISRLGFQSDERIVVRNATGVMSNLLLRSFDKIKPGNALMYYPEANVLVPRAADPKSKTPAFKCVPVRLEKMTKTNAPAISRNDPMFVR